MAIRTEYSLNSRREGPSGLSIMDERLLNVEQASRYLGIKPGTLYVWARTGAVPSVKMGRRLLFDISDLDALIERQKRSALVPRS